MKLSGYWKENGYSVVLKTDYDGLDSFNKIYISKVFTDTPVPDYVLDLPNIEWGGQGSFMIKHHDCRMK